MDLYEIILLIGVFLLGIITSYEDIKYGKIKNKWIIFSLLFSFLVYLITSLYLFFLKELNLFFIRNLFINFFISIIFAFCLWLIGFWKAGDGKLFIAYSSLVPLTFYSKGYIIFFPSLIILINLFCFLFLFFIIFVIYKLYNERKKLGKFLKIFLKEFFNFKKILISFILIFVISWFIFYFSPFENLINYLLIIIFSFLFSYFLSLKSLKFKKLKFIFLILIFSLFFIRILIDKTLYNKEFIIRYLSIFFIMNFLRSIIKVFFEIGDSILLKEIAVNNLKENMILAEEIIEIGKLKKDEIKKLKKENIKLIKYKGKYYKIQIKKFSIQNILNKEKSLREEIELFKKLKIKKIKIYETYPFAPLLFIGVILTLISKGSFILFLRSIF